MYTPKTADHHIDPLTKRLFNHFSPLEVIEGYRVHYPDCYRFTLDFEGGYVNDPDDPGGCTNMGITIGTLRGWRGDDSVSCEDVANLSETEAALIYASNYWAPVWGNQLPIGINCQVWDFGVNAGPTRAIKYLQWCVGTSQDGFMGPKTLAATAAADQMELLALYYERRQSYYEQLSNFSIYGDGWTRRNDECYMLSVDLLAAGPNPLPTMPDLDGEDVQDQIAVINQRLDRLEHWAEGF